MPEDGRRSNSLGKGTPELPTSLMLLSIKLSWLRGSSLAQPSAGIRKLNVMGIREVFTRVQ